MSLNYSTIQVSQEAKEFAKSIIDWYELEDTELLGFWLGIAVNSDYIVLAIYAESCLADDNTLSPFDVTELIRQKVPNNYFPF